METASHFAVEYRYYQYNDGSANNGTFSREASCASPEEAIALAEKINAAAKHYKDGTTGDRDEETAQSDEELANDLIPGACGGYFLSAKAYLVRVERKELLAEAVSR